MNTSLVIDSTGSIKVREYLASLDSKKLPGRLIHVALYNNGQIGIVAIEGKSRNPNVSDLIAEFWNTLVDDRVLSSTFMKAQLDRTEIGLGCGSHTMIMPDTIVSLHSAGMAEMIRQNKEHAIDDDVIGINNELNQSPNFHHNFTIYSGIRKNPDEITNNNLLHHPASLS